MAHCKYVYTHIYTYVQVIFDRAQPHPAARREHATVIHKDYLYCRIYVSYLCAICCMYVCMHAYILCCTCQEEETEQPHTQTLFFVGFVSHNCMYVVRMYVCMCYSCMYACKYTFGLELYVWCTHAYTHMYFVFHVMKRRPDSRAHDSRAQRLSFLWDLCPTIVCMLHACMHL
jgi:hypothetical protein